MNPIKPSGRQIRLTSFSAHIFAGIVARFPNALHETFISVKNELIQPITMLILLAILLGIVAAIIFFEQAQRRIPVQYAKRLVGKKTYAGQSTHLPLKINTSGVIPPIFASSLLMFPATIANFVPGGYLDKMQQFLRYDAWFYNSAYVLLIIFFCYFYTAVTFNPIDVADNMKKYGGYIPAFVPARRPPSTSTASSPVSPSAARSTCRSSA